MRRSYCGQEWTGKEIEFVTVVNLMHSHFILIFHRPGPYIIACAWSVILYAFDKFYWICCPHEGMYREGETGGLDPPGKSIVSTDFHINSGTDPAREAIASREMSVQSTVKYVDG